ncbi:S8 family peptidase [candidate division KSB1 bacterium]|nr:S8 family peptidase [candidate division KSB1 bacterium]
MSKINILIISILFLMIDNPLFGIEDHIKYWIFFKDKEITSSEQAEYLRDYIKNLTPRTKSRRERISTSKILADASDLPVSESYIDRLKSAGITPIVTSNWMNAISTFLDAEQVVAIKTYDFIDRVQPVIKYKRSPVEQADMHKSNQRSDSAPIHKYDYGASFDQNNLMRVPDIHDLGIEGRGVIIGMLDTGFRFKDHTAFSAMYVIDEYDFIHNDNNTANESNDFDAYNQDDHGTKTLSTIGGFLEGTLIGPAFGSRYLLAKTEEMKSETIIEEDFWVAGLEWLESKGADIVNSSLGYNDWYTYSDMDGNTAITTIAADIAVSKGVVIVNSMGNEGNQTGSIIAPADGDSVISVGAVYNNGLLTSFSSVGPTWDGRIKPDIVAQGSGIVVASPSSPNSFTYSSGTSFSSPLTAGVAALLLSAHPQLTPMQVRDALKFTANNARNPNNEYGWGIVNAYEAIYSLGLFFSNLPIITNATEGYQISINVFSKNDVNADSTFLYYSYNDASFNPVRMVRSDQLAYEYNVLIPYDRSHEKINLYFKAKDRSNDTKLHPYNAPEMVFTFNPNDMSIHPGEPPVQPELFVLYQNYPNPFNGRTTIKYDVLKPAHVSLNIYNVLGQRVRNLVDRFQLASSYLVDWNGDDDHENPLGSGIYFVEILSDGRIQTKKMLLLK